MLTIHVRDESLWDESTETFIDQDIATLELEHSLFSLSKWESKFEKAFLGPGERTGEEILGYVEAMILTPDFPPEVISRMSKDNLDKINVYLNAKQTATWFPEERGGGQSSEVITSELIYYWMVAFNIPFECQHWHLNRLFTLIRVCSVKNQSPKKESPAERAARQRSLNEQRRRQMNTSG